MPKVVCSMVGWLLPVGQTWDILFHITACVMTLAQPSLTQVGLKLRYLPIMNLLIHCLDIHSVCEMFLHNWQTEWVSGYLLPMDRITSHNTPSSCDNNTVTSTPLSNCSLSDNDWYFVWWKHNPSVCLLIYKHLKFSNLRKIGKLKLRVRKQLYDVNLTLAHPRLHKSYYLLRSSLVQMLVAISNVEYSITEC